MILVIDIGNSNITFGIFDTRKSLASETFERSLDREAVVRPHESVDGRRLSNAFDGDELVKRFRAPSNFCTPMDDYLALIKENLGGNKLEGAIVASVVTDFDYKFKFALDKMFGFETLVVSSATPCDLQIKLDNPSEVGADRIANAVGVLEKFGQNAIVVDFGTATTFEVVTKKREFIGGLITTGLHLQLDALSAKTSKLPQIELYPPKRAVATNTVDAILSGIVLGNACMIDGMIKKFKAELAPEEYIVVATGGFASFIEGYMKGSFDYIMPDLTLEGLKSIYHFCHAELDSASIQH